MAGNRWQAQNSKYFLMLRVISCKEFIFDKMMDAQDCLFLTGDLISRRFCRLRRW